MNRPMACLGSTWLKQMPFDNLSEQQVNKAVALLTNRPRKSLGYQTPQAVFESGIIN